jgi:hypothetical protein
VVRKLTSLPVIIMLVVAIAVLPMLLTAAFHPGLGVIFGVLGPVAFWLTAAIVVRGRRVTAWLRGSVPWEFRDAPTAWALMTSAETTGERINNQPVMRFRMKVYAPEGEFDSVMYAVLPVYPANQFQTGAHYPVRYLPGDHSQVAYDTTPAAQSLGPRPGGGSMAEPTTIADDGMSGTGFINYPSAPAAGSAPLVSGTSVVAGGVPGIDPAAMMRQFFPDRVAGKALVKAQRVTGQSRGNLAETVFDLTITGTDGSVTDATVTKWLPAELAAKIPVGATVDVFYSPTSPGEVSMQITSVTTSELFG